MNVRAAVGGFADDAVGVGDDLDLLSFEGRVRGSLDGEVEGERVVDKVVPRRDIDVGIIVLSRGVRVQRKAMCDKRDEQEKAESNHVGGVDVRRLRRKWIQ
jgi:hypothetical protein